MYLVISSLPMYLRHSPQRIARDQLLSELIRHIRLSRAGPRWPLLKSGGLLSYTFGTSVSPEWRRFPFGLSVSRFDGLYLVGPFFAFGPFRPRGVGRRTFLGSDLLLGFTLPPACCIPIFELDCIDPLHF